MIVCRDVTSRPDSLCGEFLKGPPGTSEFGFPGKFRASLVVRGRYRFCRPSFPFHVLRLSSEEKTSEDREESFGVSIRNRPFQEYESGDRPRKHQPKTLGRDSAVEGGGVSKFVRPTRRPSRLKGRNARVCEHTEACSGNVRAASVSVVLETGGLARVASAWHPHGVVQKNFNLWVNVGLWV